MKLYTTFRTALASLALLTASACDTDKSPNQTTFGYDKEYNATVYASPALPVNSVLAANPGGPSPAIVIDNVLPYDGVVNPTGQDVYESVVQVAYGRVFNVTAQESQLRVILYAGTNLYWLQPLTQTAATITDGAWALPSHAATQGLVALLVSADFDPPATLPLDGLPVPDGTSILAVSASVAGN